ncbi:hypothetical protein BJX63DRAFT_397880, partial [Aspergillus granulosus]
MKLRLDHGADPRTINYSLEENTIDVAICAGRIDAVKLLIDAGTDIDSGRLGSYLVH